MLDDLEDIYVKLCAYLDKHGKSIVDVSTFNENEVEVTANVTCEGLNNGEKPILDPYRVKTKGRGKRLKNHWKK